ncbi:hypothetical protein BASA81_001980 [Batrachochytrium salamandrivorans]|nr:hypothetical protein BASA81_001980 [Batrachochytrium salamandrivorans]
MRVSACRDHGGVRANSLANGGKAATALATPAGSWIQTTRSAIFQLLVFVCVVCGQGSTFEKPLLRTHDEPPSAADPVLVGCLPMRHEQGFFKHRTFSGQSEDYRFGDERDQRDCEMIATHLVADGSVEAVKGTTRLLAKRRLASRRTTRSNNPTPRSCSSS